MRIVLVTVSSVIGFLSLLAGCAVAPPESVAPPPAPVFVPAASPETDLPAQRAAPSAALFGGSTLQAATSNPRPAMQASSPSANKPLVATRRLEALPVKFVEQSIAAGIAMPTAKDTGSKPAPKAAPGPAWLKACQHRQQQADAIMCDADSLLASPSDKVMVYVRDAKLSGKQPDGQRIALREGLPRLYRIFVLD